MSGATVPGTRAYGAAKSLAASAVLGKTGFTVSRMGFGTYRVNEEEPEHREALKLALTSGCNLIDTSANYTDGSSERVIGQILRDFNRGEIVIVTKAGYVQGENLELARARIEQNRPFAEMVKFAHDCWHCIHPEYLATQITRSLSRLQVDQIDVLLLHNPEYFLKKEGDHAEYYRRIKAAFAHLETEVQKGRIQYYGVSSNTFGEPKESPEFTSLEVLLELAREVSPEHHFAVVEFPFNLFEPGAVLEKNNSGKSVTELAREARLGTLANRPLNAFAGSELVRLADVGGVNAIGLEDAEENLRLTLNDVMQLESNYPGNEIVPAQRIAWGHVLRNNLERLSNSETWSQTLKLQIRPAVEQAVQKLAHHSETAPWADEYRFRTEELFSAFSAWLISRAQARSRELSDVILTAAPELSSSPTLSQKTLRTYLAFDDIDCVLVGMRKSVYVQDALAAKATISESAARAAIEAVVSDLS